MAQPKGFDVLSVDGTKLVYKSKISLYGLKQSGRNWNRVLHEYLLSVGEISHFLGIDFKRENGVTKINQKSVYPENTNKIWYV